MRKRRHVAFPATEPPAWFLASLAQRPVDPLERTMIGELARQGEAWGADSVRLVVSRYEVTLTVLEEELRRHREVAERARSWATAYAACTADPPTGDPADLKFREAGLLIAALGLDQPVRV